MAETKSHPRGTNNGNILGLMDEMQKLDIKENQDIGNAGEILQPKAYGGNGIKAPFGRKDRSQRGPPPPTPALSTVTNRKR